MLPDWIQEELTQHRMDFAPVWRGFLSDHLPMSSVAMWKLGFPQAEVQSWMAAYRRLLEPAPVSPPVECFEQAVGDPARYRSLIEYFDREQSRLGTEDTLRLYLPTVLSAWGADAFHPVIRLGYAVRFEFPPEISAGLAYLSIKGPNPKLETLARESTAGPIVWPPEADLTGRTFDERYNDCLRDAAPTVRLPPDPLSTFASELLGILRTSQNFFALHLLTATHSFMCVDAKLKLECEGLFAAGILVGYRAAGSPIAGPGHTFEPKRFGFDHDVKLAFTLSDLAERFDSERFKQTADAYLNGLPAVDVGLEEIEREAAQREGGALCPVEADESLCA